MPEAWGPIPKPPCPNLRVRAPGIPAAIARASRAAEATAAEDADKPLTAENALTAGLSPDLGRDAGARSLSPLAARCCRRAATGAAMPGLVRLSSAPWSQPSPDPPPAPSPAPASLLPLAALVRPLILPAGRKKSPVELWKGCQSLSPWLRCGGGGGSLLFERPMHKNEACSCNASKLRYL